MWGSVIALVQKILEFVTPLLNFLLQRANEEKRKKDTAQSNMDKEAKREGQESMDDFWDDWTSKRGA